MAKSKLYIYLYSSVLFFIKTVFKLVVISLIAKLSRHVDHSSIPGEVLGAPPPGMCSNGVSGSLIQFVTYRIAGKFC